MSDKKEEFNQVLHQIANICEKKRKENKLNRNVDYEVKKIMYSVLESFEITEVSTLTTYFKVKFNFEVKPIKHEKHPGCLMLYAGDEEKDPVVVDGYVNRKALMDWIGVLLSKKMFKQGTLQHFNPQDIIRYTPLLEFDYKDWPFPEPSLPSSVYKLQPWCFLTKTDLAFDERIFVVSDYWESSLINMNRVPTLALQVMTHLCKEYFMSKITRNMLRAIILPELPLESKIDLDDFLLKMWEKLCQSLIAAHLDAFLMENVNVYRDLSPFEFEDLYSKASKVLYILKKGQSGDIDALSKLRNPKVFSFCF